MILVLATGCLAMAAQDSGGLWNTRWRANGSSPQEEFGEAVAAIADLDADGASEVIVGASRWDGLNVNEGACFLYSGKSGNQLLLLPGGQEIGGLGTAVAGVGDVNGDGFPDFAATAPGHSPYGHQEGSVYVYSGANGAQLLRMNGIGAGDGLGNYVAGAGDIDGDGLADVLVGNPGDDVFGFLNGASYVYSGLDGRELRVLGGVWSNNGRSGDGLGDVNCDGVPDLVISDGFALSFGGGSVAVYSGADGSMLYRVQNPVSYDDFGRSVANVGDINRDGTNDFIVGAPATISDRRKGRAYVYSGSDGSKIFDLWGDTHLDAFGWDVAGPEDVNGDGYPDLLVGAPFSGLGSPGAVFIHSGYDGGLLAKLRGENLGDEFGYSVAGTTDVNADGLADVIAGAYGADYGGDFSGSVYLYELHSYLGIEPRTVSASVGGLVAFTLDFPSSEAGRGWRLLASTDRPGQTRAGGVHVPLADSLILTRMLHDPPAVFSSTAGILDASGDASVTATLAPGQVAAWVGSTLRFAAVSFDPPKSPRLSSAGMRISVVP